MSTNYFLSFRYKIQKCKNNPKSDQMNQHCGKCHLKLMQDNAEAAE